MRPFVFLTLLPSNYITTMGFLTELGKGFVRSAVNQVGRDTGKIISNTIYGDAHATPIRRVGQSTSGTYFDTETNQQLTPEQILEYANTDGWKPEHSSYTWPQRFCLMFVATIIGIFLFPFCLVLPIVPLYIIYRGIKQITKKQTTYTKNVEVPTYKSDRRYKRGIRFDGTITQKVSLPLNSTEEDKAIHKRLGWSYIFCAVFLWGVVFFCGSYLMYSGSKSDVVIITEQTTDTTHIN